MANEMVSLASASLSSVVANDAGGRKPFCHMKSFPISTTDRKRAELD